MAHDLKSPFKPVMDNAERLVNFAETLPRAQIKTLAESVHLSANNTWSLLESLLQWARLQMGRMPYQPMALNLRQILQQMVTLFAATAQNKGIHLTSLLQADVIIHADEYMVATIIRNLTNNALKFTPRNGQVTLSAQLGIRNEKLEIPNSQFLIPNYVEVWVSDNGVGISPENLAKLFKVGEHVITLGTAQEKGTGLGLVMCREMVQLHGGTIWVESQAGGGTTFKFTIPAVEPLPVGDWSVVAQTVEVKPERYMVPTKAQLETLYASAESGNFTQVADWLEEIQAQDEQYRPFCDHVARLADVFDWAGVMNLVTAHLSKG